MIMNKQRKYYEEAAIRIRRKRKMAGLSQVELGKLSNMTHIQISLIETRKYIGPYKNIEKLDECLDKVLIDVRNDLLPDLYKNLKRIQMDIDFLNGIGGE